MVNEIKSSLYHSISRGVQKTLVGDESEEEDISEDDREE
jgi:hypothetical protein